ncbi:hypothetical protein NYG90_05975 [Helicobacter sp. XJK30-2]|uniref:Uncharacterized protein n=1 Tax=Helicobacter zhangjianzhongii TaxID=2974574 RepID=A0ACC6FTG9_9HELI|nr:hypothetical protein [Helicobacter sp. XJK30-2]MDL0082222.1 hypothetical protein [Helicobacter sp. XJK30-2]
MRQCWASDAAVLRSFFRKQVKRSPLGDVSLENKGYRSAQADVSLENKRSGARRSRSRFL